MSSIVCKSESPAEAWPWMFHHCWTECSVIRVSRIPVIIGGTRSAQLGGRIGVVSRGFFEPYLFARHSCQSGASPYQSQHLRLLNHLPRCNMFS